MRNFKLPICVMLYLAVATSSEIHLVKYIKSKFSFHITYKKVTYPVYYYIYQPTVCLHCAQSRSEKDSVQRNTVPFAFVGELLQPHLHT